MRINLTYDPASINAVASGGADKLSYFKVQVNAAAQLLSGTFLDPVTVNIDVECAPVGLARSS